jgi:23S rRNA pseudouridine1911/1915/1917 synthase
MTGFEVPSVLAETGDYAVVRKPPGMHCAPLGKGSPLSGGEGGTLLDWYAALFPPVRNLNGRKAGEGGLLHRLDFETHGLVLFAKNQNSLDFLRKTQEEGGFVKEYGAVCQKAPPDKAMLYQATPAAGFPQPPQIAGLPDNGPPAASQSVLFSIESFFRPFGPGRKEVRPVTTDNKHWEIAKDRGETYKTKVIAFAALDPSRLAFTLRITRGFRHQIRCHLAWIAYPILNDPLYGKAPQREQSPQEEQAPPDESFPPPRSHLALRCQALFFNDPRSGEKREYRIPPLEIP